MQTIIHRFGLRKSTCFTKGESLFVSRAIGLSVVYLVEGGCGCEDKFASHKFIFRYISCESM